MASKTKLHLRLPVALILALASASATVNATVTVSPEAVANESAEGREGTGSKDTYLALTADAVLHGLAAGLDARPDSTGTAALANASDGTPNAVALAVADQLPQGALRDWTAVASHQLDDMRGGFDTSLHLTLSFGIERAVYLNGALVTTTSFNLPAMTGSRPDDPAYATMPSSAVALVQNGAGNTFASGPSTSPMAATVIQNTLNNQTLQGVTTINAAANSLQLLRANAFQTMMLESLNQGVVPH